MTITSLHRTREAHVREDGWAAVVEAQARLRELFQALEADLPAIEELARLEPRARRLPEAIFDAIALGAGARRAGADGLGSLWVALHAIEVPPEFRRA